MTYGEAIYLIFVIAAFAAFCGTLAWGVAYTKKGRHQH